MSLQKIQTELNAPKNQTNTFGQYNYRSAEDILTALKPLLAKHQYSLVINDSLELIGDRYYVKATASLYDEKMSLITHSSAYAREELMIKKQQASQITGGTSSYARKYALNGLFLIDDSKDADTQDNTNHQSQGEKKQTVNTSVINEKQLKLLNTLLSNKREVLKGQGFTRESLHKHYKVDSFTNLPTSAFNGLITWLEGL